MVAKEITFKDYNGVERKETFLFNLSEAELMELQLGEVGGLDEKIKLIQEKKDVPTIMSLFKDLIKRSYGVKSADGREFEKSEALTKSFLQTEAYSNLYIELLTDDNAAAAFFNGVINADSIMEKANNAKASTAIEKK